MKRLAVTLAVTFAVVQISSSALAEGSTAAPLPATSQPPNVRANIGAGVDVAPAGERLARAPDPCAPPNECQATSPSRDGVEDRAPGAPRSFDSLRDAKLLHGFRLGYAFVMEHDKPIRSLDGKSLAEKTDMRSPHHFLIGYEAFYRMVSHSWLNVILVGNVMVGGLEQSQFYPSGNMLIGFEWANSFQTGVGVHLTPLKGQAAHTIFAAGWTPRVGTFYVPLHAFFIPDVDGVHQIGATTGVTF